MSVPEGKPVGAVAGRYAIERELGRGGSAIVYLARDLLDANGDARVALKLLHHEFSGSKAAQRFELEVRLLREFEHPHILPVTDAGEWDGRPFYAMPYVDGESLQGRLKRERRLPFTEVVRIGQRLCEALAYAHERKVVHRDVKPANVMLAGDAVYLTDFGVAKALEPIEGAPHSTTGVARGTRAYMSPEQVAADRDLDHRSDIFSLGCVLYEMIAGVRPFYSADEGRELMRRLVEAPDPLQRHRDEVPEGLESAVMKALAREPADRWGSVGEVGVGLGGSGAGRDKRISIIDLGRWVRRPVAATSSILLLGAITAWMAMSPSRGEACTLPALHGTSEPHVLLAVEHDKARSTPVRTEDVADAMRRAVLRWQGATVAPGIISESWDDAHMALCAVSDQGGNLLFAARVTRQGQADSVRADVRVIGHEVDLRRTIVADVDGTLDPVRWTRLLRDALQTKAPQIGPSTTDIGTVSFVAWRECDAGWSAISSGLPDSASRHFLTANLRQSNYACALLGSVVARQLADARVVSEWGARATVALSSDVVWSTPERTILQSAVDRASPGGDASCRQLESLANERPRDYLVAMLFADCLATDSTVIIQQDGTLAFRSSWMEARRRLIRTIDHAPDGYARLVVPRLREVAPTAPTIRWGWMPNERVAQYGAYPTWESDTLALHPVSRQRIARSESSSVPRKHADALRAGKQLQLEIAQRWAMRAPSSGAAHLAYALALELVGRLQDDGSQNAHGLEELDRAAESNAERVPIHVLLESRARLLLKSGRLEELAQLLESALRNTNAADRESSRVLAPLALLVGRPRDGERLLRAQLAEQLAVPLSDATRRELAAFMIYSSVGCCPAMLDSLELALRNRLAVELDVAASRAWSERLLARGVSLAAPCRGWKSVNRLSESTDAIVRVQRDIAAGLLRSARRELQRLRDERRGFSPGDIAVDYVVQEAYASLAVGDSVTARQQLQEWLAALPINGALELRELSQAAAIPRLLALAERLDLALPDPWTAVRLPRVALAQLLSRADRGISQGVNEFLRSGQLCGVSAP